MQPNTLKWVYLVVLSLIWGSSFILIKKSLIGLTDFQVGALRIVLTTLFLVPVGVKSLRQIKKTHWKYIAISGFISSFFPPFLFAIAQTRIDSGVASIINSIVPINTLLLGVLIFRIKSTPKQLVGILIGLAGTVWLIYSGKSFQNNSQNLYGLLVVLATLGYALNVNLIKKYLPRVSPLAVTTGSFVCIIVPAILVLWLSGFFKTVFITPTMWQAVGYVALLALLGTAFAKVLFNKLILVASPVFASSVTYTMPIVAVLLGWVDGEKFSAWQILAAITILVGVYLTHKKRLKN